MPKKKKTKADQPPQGEKKGTIQCRYCPRSFSRRNCYRHHLVKHKDILYAEKNKLQALWNEPEAQENQLQARPSITNKKRAPLAPIPLNELTTIVKNYKDYEKDRENREDREDRKDGEDRENYKKDYKEDYEEKITEALHNVVRKNLCPYCC